MKRKHFFAAAISVCLATVSGVGVAALSSASDARVGFQAAGPAGMKIEGTTSEISVTEADGNVVVDVPLSNVKTGIELRDHHMKEKYLEVAKYPSATLIVARSALKLPPSGGQVELDAPGTLKLHGQARPVTVHYDAKGDGAGFTVNGRLRLKMTDFGITVPSYLGVTVKPEVDVSATFHVAGN